MSETGLRASRLFSGLDDDQLQRLGAIAETLVVNAGGAVFRQGEPAEAFFFLMSGRVKVFKRLRDGRTATLRHVTSGNTFAESVLDADAYPSNAEAMETSVMLRIPTALFRDLVIADPEIALRMLSSMAGMMLLLNRRVEELLLPVPARLARYLLDLCDQKYPPAAGDVAETVPRSLVCYLPTSKQELASRLGTVPETLSRTLNRLVKSRLIAVEGDRLEILDRVGLTRLAQR